MSSLYYTAPSEAIFEDIKAAAIKIWQTYDDQFGYASGKIERVNRVDNIQDNYMYLISMFDSTNEGILYHLVSADTRQLLNELRAEGSILYPVQSKESLLQEMNGPDDKRWELLQ